MPRIVWVCLHSLIALVGAPVPLLAQPSHAAAGLTVRHASLATTRNAAHERSGYSPRNSAHSTSDYPLFETLRVDQPTSCLALHWWNHDLVCGVAPGRETQVSSLLVGTVVGAMSAAPAGLVFRGQCNAGVTSAAARGAVTGSVMAYSGALLLSRVSRAALEQRQRDERQYDRTHKRSRVWHTLRPAVVWVGTAALGGALIGAADGAIGSTSCGSTTGDGALRGAGVYAASTTLLVASALGVYALRH
jgi:hypothetical protein